MPSQLTWEDELDTIADAIRSGLHQDARSTREEQGCVDAHCLAQWFDALVALLERLQRENDPEGLSEVLDVLALLLKTCADGQWRFKLQENPVEQEGFFSFTKLRGVFEALETVCEHDSDGEAYNLTTDSIASLLFIAVTPQETEAVLEELRRLPIHGRVRTMLQNDTSHSECGSWNDRFVRFVVQFISTNVRRVDTHGGIIEALTGVEENEWIRQIWETKWHLHRKATVGRCLFDSTDHCVASLRRLFDGFSIPPVDSATPGSLREAATVMRLRHMGNQRGLRHGVDVTFIRQGRVHPEWADSANWNRVVRPSDVDNALEDGYTIGIRGVQARSAPVFALGESLQNKLGQHVNANLYWTPPDQRGFDLHVDDHCVFVLQLKGIKRWFLYKPLETLPKLYDDTIAALNSSSPSLDEEIILSEGDVLYVPRGVAHHADTSGMCDESIHLTIGVEIEEANTLGKLIQELKDRGERWTSRLTGRVKNQGLMAWHLHHADSFRVRVAESIGIDVHELTDQKQEAWENLRARLLEQRQRFLRRRMTDARALVTLHASTGHDTGWLEAVETKYTGDQNTIDEARRPSKRSRHL